MHLYLYQYKSGKTGTKSKLVNKLSVWPGCPRLLLHDLHFISDLHLIYN